MSNGNILAAAAGNFVVGIVLTVILVSAAQAGARTERVKRLTVSQFLSECRSEPVECTKDAKAADDVLALENSAGILDSLQNGGSYAAGVYCEPDGLSDKQRRDRLIDYFSAHGELTSDAFLDGARKAFVDVWGAAQCQKNASEAAAKAATLGRTTVAQYLSTCESDTKTCDALTGDALDDYVDAEMRTFMNIGTPYTFCAPRLSDQAVRKAVVRYLSRHGELSSGSLRDGARAAFDALWPNHGAC